MTSPLCSGPSKTSIPLLGSLPTAQRPASSHPPAHSPQTRWSSCRSSNLPGQLLLRTPCLRPPLPGDCVTPTFMSLRPRGAPAPQAGSQDITLFVTSSPSEQECKEGRALSSCCTGSHTYWAHRGLGRETRDWDTSREDVSDPGAQLPNLTFGLNGRCSLANCI